MSVMKEELIRGTGGQIDGMVMALIDHSYDKNEKVVSAVLRSLQDLGLKQPNLVLSSCHSYLLRHKKLPLGHKMNILRVMEYLSNKVVELLEKSLALEIIQHSVAELVTKKESVPECQNISSNIVVSFGKIYHHETMDSLLMMFQPGVVPYYYVIQTLGNLAAANSYDIVPFLKAVLTSMIPMLGSIKQDNLKLAFSDAINKFAEAIFDYIVNLDKAPDKTVKKEVFCDEMDQCYDILFYSWISTRDLKLKLSIITALGNMCSLMSKTKMEEQIPRFLPAMLTLFKRHPDNFSVTQCLCKVLESCSSLYPNFLSNQLDSIFFIFFAQISILPDLSAPESIKNHNELLRCFDVIVKSYPDYMISFLLNKVEIVQERPRVGALLVFKHLINSSADYLSDKMLVILTGLRPILQDPNNKVKRTLVQVIVAMAHHGYLECPGSQIMLDFLIKQCCLPESDPQTRRPTDSDYVSNEQLKSICENILHLLATTVSNLESILWPVLLEYIVLEEFIPANNIVIKCVTHLASKKRAENSDDFIINFNKYNNVPRPVAIIARLIVFLGTPFYENNRGLNILKLLKEMSPTLESKLESLWDKMLPELFNHLQDAVDDKVEFSQKGWEDKILSFVNKTIEEMDDEEWTVRLGNTVLKQFHLYEHHPEDKNIAMKILGAILRKCNNKQFLNLAITTVFGTLKYSNEDEREGCMIFVGLVASVHTDIMIVKLEEEAKSYHKKTSSFMNFLKDMKGDSDYGKFCATFILCYAYIALYAPLNILTTRIETPILRVMLKLFSSSKEESVKMAFIRGIDMVAQALHPSNVFNETFILGSRKDLIERIMALISKENPTEVNSALRVRAIYACTNLIKLNPPLSGPDLTTYLQKIGGRVLSLEEKPSKEFMEENKALTAEDYQKFYSQSFDAFNNLLKEILLLEFSCETFDFIFQNLHTWLISKKLKERLNGVAAVEELLKSFIENLNSGNRVMLSFTKLGSTLGTIVPIVFNNIHGIYKSALNSIELLIQLAARNQAIAHDYDKILSDLRLFREQYFNNISNHKFSTEPMAKNLALILPYDQLLPYMSAIIDGLRYQFHPVRDETLEHLMYLFSERGNEMGSDIAEIMKIFLLRLPPSYIIKDCQKKSLFLSVFSALAKQQTIPYITALFAYPIPYEQNISYFWEALGTDPGVFNAAALYFLNIMDHTAPYTRYPDTLNKNNGEDFLVAKLTYISAFFALKYSLKNDPNTLDKNPLFVKIFSSALLSMFSLWNVYPPLPLNRKDDSDIGLSILSSRSSNGNPSTWTHDHFQSVLTLSCDTTYKFQDKYFKMVVLNEGHLETLYDDIGMIARIIAEEMPDYLSEIVSYFLSFTNTVYENRRIGIFAFFAELVAVKCGGDEALMELLMTNMVNKLADPCQTIRKLCIRALSSIAQFDPDDRDNYEWFGVQKYCTTVLSAMMAGIDDDDDPNNEIIVEALNGFAKVLGVLNQDQIQGLQVNITLKIRPKMEKSCPLVRASAIKLFGALSKVINEDACGSFIEQIHNNFVSMLLHLNDSDYRVVKECKSTLKIIGPILDANHVNEMFQKHLIEDRNLIYSNFISDLSKAIVADIPEKVNFYITACLQFFKSEDFVIQGNALLLTGYFLGNLPEDMRSDVSIEHITNAMVLLLKDSHPDVKAIAAESMSNLHSY